MIYLTLIKNFLTSKIGLYIIAIVLISAACFFGYKHIYNKGYEKAKTEAELNYSKQLTIALEKQKEQQDIALKQAISVAQDKVKLNNNFNKNSKVIEKVLDKKEYIEPKMTDEDFKTFTDALREIK